MTLDELILEWSYRTNRGYPCLDNPSDIAILKTLLERLDLPAEKIIGELEDEEEDLKIPGTAGMEDSPVEKGKEVKKDKDDSVEKDIKTFDSELEKQNIEACTAAKEKLSALFDDLVNSGDIDPTNEKEINAFLNRGCAFRLYKPLKQLLLKKGFKNANLKPYSSQLRDLTEKTSTEERKIFNEYIKDESKQINFPTKTRGNLRDEMKKSGLPDSIVTKLITHTAQDEGKKGVGMGELALAIVFKNITDAPGDRGDLGFDGEQFEIKAQSATLGAKPEGFKASLDTVKKFERYGLKREQVPNKKGTGTSTKLTFGGEAYKLNQFTDVLPLAYQATKDKEGLKTLVKEMLLNDAKHLPEAVEYAVKDMDLSDAQSIQSIIAKIHFYNYVVSNEENKRFTHFLAHDMGKKQNIIIGDGEYIYVSGTPGEMADKLMEAGATFEKTSFNNMRPRIGFGERFKE